VTIQNDLDAAIKARDLWAEQCNRASEEAASLVARNTVLTRERDEARANGAASERAAIVAWLEKRADVLGRKTSQQFRDQSDECEYAASCITRLDHHRDGGGE